MSRLNDFSQRALPGFLIVGLLAGLLAPRATGTLRALTLPCLAVLMFFPALKLDRENLATGAVSQWRVLAAGFPVIFGVIPLLMYALGRLAGLDPLLLAGLVLGSATPSIVSAPYFVGLMRGHVGVAFSLMVGSTLLSPLVLPLLAFLLLGGSTRVNLVYVAEMVFLVIAVPVALAALLRRVSPALSQSLLRSEHIFSASALVVLNWIIIGMNQRLIVGSLTGVLLPMFLLGMFQDLGIFLITRRVSRRLVCDEVSKALAVCFGLKNIGLVGGVMIAVDESLALASGVVSLAHVLMFVLISARKDRL
jgi:BASS family bile acid:Na+ symporter